MKISKHIHSCLLVEDQGKVYLFDPGSYTFEEDGLNVDQLTQLDFILITHEHQDHMSVPLLKKLLEKFPEVKILANKNIVEKLSSEGIESSSEVPENIKVKDVPHERMFEGEPPINWQIDLNNKLTHPGDSHSFNTICEVLALPIQAPWGSTTAAVNLAVKLKPRVIIPIHDWHWSKKAQENYYKRLTDFFEPLGIRFHGLQTDLQIEL